MLALIIVAQAPGSAPPDPILIVEDDPDVAFVLSEFLARHGRPAIVARTGGEALRLLRSMAVPLVLVDLRLPDMDGTDVMRAAREHEPAPDLVVLTGHASFESAIVAVEAGAAAYLTKPCDFDRLRGIIDQVFERRRLGQENARLHAQLSARLAETETLLAISATISATLDVREAFRRICRELARLTGADTASVYGHDAAGDLLVPYAAYHVPKEIIGELATLTLPLREQGFHLPLWKDRRAVFSDDVGRDPRFTHEAFRRMPHQSGLLLPLVLDGQVTGAFYLVWWTARRRFSDQELAPLEAVCQQVALFLRNARLYEQGTQDRRRLETLNEVSRRLASVHDTDQILSLIVGETSRLVNAEAVALRLLEGDEFVLSARTEAAAPLTRRERVTAAGSLSGLIVRERTPIVIEDLRAESRYEAAHTRGAAELGFRGFLGVPLNVRGRAIGTLNVYTRSARRFLPDEVSLVSALADQASLAIEKGRLLREAEAGRQLLDRLYRVAIAMQTPSGREERLRAFIRGAHDVVGFDRIYVLLATEAGAGLELATTHGEPGIPAVRLPLTPAAGAFYQVYESRRPLAVLSDEDLPRVLPIDPGYARHPYFRTNRFVIAPLVVGDRVIGVACADNKRSKRPIPLASVEPFTLLCQHLATALENTALLEETEHQARQLEQVFAAISDGILVLDLNGRITALNQRGSELLGVPAAAVTGRPFSALLDALGEVAPEPFAGLGSGGLAPARGDLELASPVPRSLQWQATPTHDAQGSTVGLTITFQDVTQEREVSRMKSDFVSFVTHQLRTPLSGIKWMLELTAQDGEIPEESRSYVQDAREAADRLIGLVNDMLDISRLESGKLTVALKPTSLEAVTGSVLDELAPLIAGKAHRLFIDGAGGTPPALVDPQLMRQVVLNLVSNAIKYTPAKGEITIHMGLEGDELRWAVRDSGIGIPRDAQRRLFEKFFRADNAVTLETEGTGLGLYLVRLIIERFGGRIWCESEEGEGSTFVVALPRAEADR